MLNDIDIGITNTDLYSTFVNNFERVNMLIGKCKQRKNTGIESPRAVFSEKTGIFCNDTKWNLVNIKPGKTLHTATSILLPGNTEETVDTDGFVVLNSELKDGETSGATSLKFKIRDIKVSNVKLNIISNNNTSITIKFLKSFFYNDTYITINEILNKNTSFSIIDIPTTSITDYCREIEITFNHSSTDDVFLLKEIYVDGEENG